MRRRIPEGTSRRVGQRLSYEEEDTCMRYEEEI